ncbi:sulfatase-like hydrolase/transferase [Mesorhizobium ventifaucium]|uniref:sulfatase-like hydrolase/transferase n=1 Tax=Mesorhizobium ventifaucium TaxID=666020 RepID=UPI0020A709EF|nr:sulfatase-like hydrolase/transferase [Mesorhizobium ventifaucium]
MLAISTVASGISTSAKAQAAGAKPNILVIFGDDVGYWNICAYNWAIARKHRSHRERGCDLHRPLRPAVLHRRSFGFITGQSCFCTGLLKVGLPGAKEGLSEKDPTLAELFKPQGYVTGQFGKNHLGDRNEHLPTVHGFDEFFGNLYHLNAEDEPEHPDYPKDPAVPTGRAASIHGSRRSESRARL